MHGLTKRSIRDLVHAERRAAARAAYEQIPRPRFVEIAREGHAETGYRIEMDTFGPDPVALATFELQLQTWRLK